MPVLRPLVILLAALGGGAVGTLGTFAHRFVVGPARWPVGLVLALLLTACAGRLVHALRPGPGAVVGMLVGWFAVYALAASRRPEGDVLVPGGAGFPGAWLGLAWLALGVAVLMVTLLRPGRSDRAVRQGVRT